MTQFPEDPSNASPLLQGIQQLKYDETANTPLGKDLGYNKVNYRGPLPNSSN